MSDAPLPVMNALAKMPDDGADDNIIMHKLHSIRESIAVIRIRLKDWIRIMRAARLCHWSRRRGDSYLLTRGKFYSEN